MPIRLHAYFAGVAVVALIVLLLASAPSALGPVQSTSNTTQIDPLLYAERAYEPIGADTWIASASTSARHVPIVVYHVVRPSYASDSAELRAFAATPEVFDAQMAHLNDAGYHVIGFGELEDALTVGAPLPEKPIILTFDDGWRDQYEYAFPVLKKYGYTATFFVFTHAIGYPSFMTWEQLKEMVAAGMTIGSHSWTHPYLTRGLSRPQLVREISDSKATLERELGVTVTEFAYPFGLTDATTTELVAAAGYRAARSDGYTGPETLATIFDLSAQNAPTTLASFAARFP